MSEFEKTEHNKLQRAPKRGHYDKATVYEIIDTAPICHVAFVVDNNPFIIPINHARIDDEIILHGAKTGRLIKHIAAGHPLCLTMTHVDGIVLARSAYHHSMNYRSAVVFGTGRIVEDPETKMEAFKALVEHVMPQRWNDSRKPNEKEINGTAIVAIAINSASAKIRTGPPSDNKSDLDLDHWAGVLPLETRALPPINDPDLRDGIEVPEYIAQYAKGS